jgi:hypothetical protein
VRANSGIFSGPKFLWQTLRVVTFSGFSPLFFAAGIAFAALVRARAWLDND